MRPTSHYSLVHVSLSTQEVGIYQGMWVIEVSWSSDFVSEVHLFEVSLTKNPLNMEYIYNPADAMQDSM